MKTYLIDLLIVFCLLSCRHVQKEVVVEMAASIDSVEPRVIPITVSDTAYRHVDQTFEQVSYVILSDEVVVGEIIRTLVADELIYILDNQNKIFCYDMNGKVKFVIDDYGPGPGEYGTIRDFALNVPLKLVWMYDSTRRRFLAYDMYTGKCKRSMSAAFLAPERMAVKDGSFFFFMGDHYNYESNSEMHYSLFYSISGTKIDKRFFPHDETANFAFSYGQEHPFYYSGDRLYYLNDYGSVVYELTTKSVRPVYKVELPNPLPMEVLKERTPSLELMQSRYSWLLSNVYEQDGLLNLWFNKEGYYYTVFYDLQKDKIIYAGKRVNNIPVKDLLFFYPICGVYKDCFFSVVPASSVRYKIDENPDVFPEELKDLTDESNHVVSFYRVRR